MERVFLLDHGDLQSAYTHLPSFGSSGVTPGLCKQEEDQSFFVTIISPCSEAVASKSLKTGRVLSSLMDDLSFHASPLLSVQNYGN